VRIVGRWGRVIASGPVGKLGRVARVIVLGRITTRFWSTAGALLALAVGSPLPAAADPPGTPVLGISEIKLGALNHDTTGLWSGFNVERSGVDANFEVLFLPLARTFGGYLRPAIGTTLNFDGNTSKAYTDLRWEIEAPSGVFFALGMGAAIHNGELGSDDPDRKALGSRVLFHPSAELGYRFDGVHSVSIFADHISNGFTRRDNDGMDTIGIRFGRRLVPFAAPPTDHSAVADFSGFYVGAVAGYQFERADWRAYVPSRSDDGQFNWGGLIGYSWQSGRGIFGIEADASPITSSLSTACVAPSTACQMDVHGVYSVRPRFGWVIDRAMMIYGTGGLAIANWDSSAVNTATGQRLGSTSATNYGVAVGAGIEYKLAPNLGLRAEIMHYGLPGTDLFISGVGGATDQLQSTVGRAGISWYFK
jgi:lipid A 3-O-deacylase